MPCPSCQSGISLTLRDKENKPCFSRFLFLAYVHFKGVSTTFLLVCFLSLNKSTCQTSKNFKSSFRSRENQILEFCIFKFYDVIKCLSIKQTFH